MKVSLIIPFYNAAAHLADCLESLRLQSYDDLELVFVDDCSTDDSLSLVEAFKSDFAGDVLICRHDHNQGVAAARNTGLDAAGGDYIGFLDADDRLVPDAVAKAVEVAVASDVDVIAWDWTLTQQGSGRYMRQPDCATAQDALRALLCGRLRWNLWLFLVRSSLFDGIRFIPGMNMGEDMMAMSRVLLRARGFANLHEALYIYTLYDSSLSKTMSEDNIAQVTANVEIVERSLAGSEFAPYVDWLKQAVKLPLLVSSRKEDWIRWAQWFPESDRSVMSNRALPLRTRLLQLLGALHCWAGVRMYNILYAAVYRRKFLK